MKETGKIVENYMIFFSYFMEEKMKRKKTIFLFDYVESKIRKNIFVK